MSEKKLSKEIISPEQATELIKSIINTGNLFDASTFQDIGEEELKVISAELGKNIDEIRTRIASLGLSINELMDRIDMVTSKQ